MVTMHARLEEAHNETARQGGEVAGEWRLRLMQAQEAHQAREAALQAELDAFQQRCDALQ